MKSIKVGHGLLWVFIFICTDERLESDSGQAWLHIPLIAILSYSSPIWKI